MQPSSIEDFEKTDAYDIGYKKGYEEGMRYAFKTLRENSDDGTIYMDIEDVEDSIRIYYRDNEMVDADEVRDAILYHPDFEHYSGREILDDIIENNIEEDK